MNKIILSLVLVLFVNITIAQTAKTNQKQGWATDNPFKTDVFIKNLGQFDSWLKSRLRYCLWLWALDNYNQSARRTRARGRPAGPARGRRPAPPRTRRTGPSPRGALYYRS